MITIIEEHHEEVIIFYEYLEKQSNNNIYSLIHVDEHADMFSPIVSQDLLNLDSKKDVEKLVYDELRISDFLLPLLHNKILNEILWVSNENKSIDFKFNIRALESQNNKLHLMMDFENENSTSIYHQSNVYSEPPTLINDNVFLTIDLDYFTCDDSNGESIEIEIAETEYNNIISNRYHPLRLAYGSRSTVKRKDDKYYLKIHEYIEHKDKKNKKDTILKKINALGKYLNTMNICPVLIVICKSCISGYVEPEEAEFIIENLEILNKYIDWK